jgi:AcrR family transcriptional regulator
MIGLLDERELQEVTLSELIQEADINKSTFYLHYQNLDDLVAAIENAGLTAIRSFLAGHPLTIETLSKDIVDFVYDNRNLFTAIAHGSSFRFHDKLLSLVELTLGVVKKNKNSFDEETCLVSSFVGSFVFILSSWLTSSCRFSKEKTAKCLDGLLKDPFYKDLIKR